MVSRTIFKPLLFKSIPLLTLFFFVSRLGVYAQSSNGKQVNYDFSRYESVYRKILTENQSNSQAYNELKEMTQSIGHRLSGTDNGKKAEEFILLRAKKNGLSKLHYQPFNLPTWQRLLAEFDVVPFNSDHFVHYPTTALAHTPLESDVVGRMVDLSDGIREDFEKTGRPAINGKIALLNIGLENKANARENLHRSEKAALAIEYGAIGAVFINAAPGSTLLTGTASVDGGLISIPAICIGNDAGAELRKWARDEDLQATIRLENHFDIKKARNVIGSIPGESGNKETILVGAHLDSWDLATGTVDNGLGTITILEAARILKALNLPMKRNVQFVWFMGEEEGLLGSDFFVRQMEKQKRVASIKYMLNFDMSGNSQGWNGLGCGRSADYFSALNQVVERVDTSKHLIIENKAELHSDHQSFMLQGIPVAQPIPNMPKEVYYCYHADCDNIKLVVPEYLDETACQAAFAIYALANEPELPATYLNSDQLRRFCIKNGLKEQLKLGKKWRWQE